MKKIMLLELWMLFTLFVQVSEASVISMQIEAVASVEGNTLKVPVRVANTGDEPAYNVRINADIGGRGQSGSLKGVLGVNEKYSEELTAPVSYQKPGRYPVVVTVDYTDQNQYPFTAVNITYLNYKEGTVGRVVGEVPAISIAESGRLKVKIKNFEQREEKIDVRLVIPKELSISTPNREVTVKPASEETMAFDLKNVSALPGSNYLIYALLEYEDANYHYANAVVSNLKVEKKKPFLETYKWPLTGAIIILAVVVIFLNLLSLWRRKRIKAI